jgi:hypothetical protein
MLAAALALVAALLALPAEAQVPSWPSTYQMNKSTILMVCNNSGYVDPQSTKGWKIVDYDWSNSKGSGTADGWAKHKPMDCEEMLVTQVEMTVAASPDTKAFIYRVRESLPFACHGLRHCQMGKHSPCARAHTASPLPAPLPTTTRLTPLAAPVAPFHLG